MATYKKKSNKLRKSRVSSESSSTKKVFDTLDTSANKSELIISKYQKCSAIRFNCPMQNHSVHNCRHSKLSYPIIDVIS